MLSVNILSDCEIYRAINITNTIKIIKKVTIYIKISSRISITYIINIFNNILIYW